MPMIASLTGIVPLFCLWIRLLPWCQRLIAGAEPAEDAGDHAGGIGQQFAVRDGHQPTCRGGIGHGAGEELPCVFRAQPPSAVAELEAVAAHRLCGVPLAPDDVDVAHVSSPQRFDLRDAEGTEG